MMTILNRLRGTWSWMAKVNALLIGMLLFFLFGNTYVAIASAIGYLIGESFGWGAWVGTLTEHKYAYSDDTPPEGNRNGIRWLASKIVNPYVDWYAYSQVALSIRGIYWWLPVLAPLYFIGLSVSAILMGVVILGLAFPIACELGYRSASLKFLGRAWELQEIWYGLIQDTVFVFLLWGIL